MPISNFNSRPGKGGRCDPPLSFLFFSCYARRTISQIVLKFPIDFGASFAQLLVKNGRVMSGHGAMTSQREKGETIFLREMLDCCTLEGDIDQSPQMLLALSLDHESTTRSFCSYLLAVQIRKTA